MINNNGVLTYDIEKEASPFIYVQSNNVVLMFPSQKKLEIFHRELDNINNKLDNTLGKIEFELQKSKEFQLALEFKLYQKVLKGYYNK